MDYTALVEASIQAIPTLAWVWLIWWAISSKGQLLIDRFVSRVESVEALGMKLALREAVQESVVPIGPDQEEATVARIERSRDVSKGLRVLWVDDNPGNNSEEVRLFKTAEIIIDEVSTTADAIVELRKYSYDVVISDIERPNSSGLDMLKEFQRLCLVQPVVFFVTNLDPERSLPIGAFGITNRVDELVHLVLDVAERRRPPTGRKR